MTQISIFQTSKEQWIEQARDAMEYLLKSGQPYVTSDDVWRNTPLPRELHKNTVGSVFNSKVFKPVGYMKSTRPSANGRVIQKWALK